MVWHDAIGVMQSTFSLTHGGNRGGCRGGFSRNVSMRSLGSLAVYPWLLLIGIGFACTPAIAVDPVRAELGVKAAWTGQAVPLIVTLYSPGPFRGTAAFDFPQLARTNFVVQGRPIVGSESLDGESYITQRHELTVFTQDIGTVVIPAFRVRFAGASSFTSEAQPKEGMTTELKFESKRPPGTLGMPVVVCATSMEVVQTWQPEGVSQWKEGDVLVRRISREANGTTAMMLNPIEAKSGGGIRVYQASLDVEDVTVRGVTVAKRVDTIRYQFEEAGEFSIPAVELQWWDPAQSVLKSKSLAGLHLQVVVDPALQERDASAQVAWRQGAQTNRVVTWWAVFLVVAVAGFIAKAVIVRVHEQQRLPTSLAIRRLKAACHSDDPSAAYHALLAWMRLSDIRVPNEVDPTRNEKQLQSFASQWRELSSRVYGPSEFDTRWDGSAFWREFKVLDRDHVRRSHASQAEVLPGLNPSMPSPE